MGGPLPTMWPVPCTKTARLCGALFFFFRRHISTCCIGPSTSAHVFFFFVECSRDFSFSLSVRLTTTVSAPTHSGFGQLPSGLIYGCVSTHHEDRPLLRLHPKFALELGVSSWHPGFHSSIWSRD